jgi:hypothetical protein
MGKPLSVLKYLLIYLLKIQLLNCGCKYILVVSHLELCHSETGTKLRFAWGYPHQKSSSLCMGCTNSNNYSCYSKGISGKLMDRKGGKLSGSLNQLIKSHCRQFTILINSNSAARKAENISLIV